MTMHLEAHAQPEMETAGQRKRVDQEPSMWKVFPTPHVTQEPNAPYYPVWGMMYTQLGGSHLYLSQTSVRCPGHATLWRNRLRRHG